MMPRITRLCGAVLSCGLAGGLIAADNGVARGLNGFSASVYRQLANSGGRNPVLSPFSIAGALSMALAGARGETANEISTVLGQGRLDPKFHAALAALVEEVTKTANEGGNQFLNANGLWVQEDFPILPDFREILQKLYHAPPSQVDFAGALERSRAQINDWTERHTNGKIHALFAPGSLDSRTRLVLSSAVYFYGKWEHAFRPNETRVEPFTLPSGGKAQTNFMHQTGRFGYAETASGQLLEMRYAANSLAFDILLPKKGTSIESIEAGLNPDQLTAWLGSIRHRAVQVAIPKFRVESDFPMTPVLSRLGMPSAFGATADFSGIDDRRDLRLSRVVHKAYVDVTEEGTEAAAATGAAVALISMQDQPDLVFRADRPFLFLIRDTRTGLILFAGRLMDPKR